MIKIFANQCNDIETKIVRLKKVMKVIAVALASLLLITTSCKKSSNAGKICFTRTQSELKIENNAGSPIYFTAFGQGILPLIDWAPVCSNNYVLANSSTSLSLSAISGYSDNDRLVVYWWRCSGTNPEKIQNVVLDRNQSECR